MRGALLIVGVAMCVGAACSRRAAITPAASLTSLPIGDRCLLRAEDGGCSRHAVSLVELVVSPEKFHDEPVQVQGYLQLQFERNTLCPVEGPNSTRDCLWVDVEGLSDPGFREGFVLIEGTFDGELRGHLWCCSGTILGITRLIQI